MGDLINQVQSGGMETLVEPVLENEHNDITLSRLELVRILQRQVPLNVYDIPEGVYRPDLLPDEYTITPSDTGGNHAVVTKREAETQDSLPKDAEDNTETESVDGDPVRSNTIRVGGSGQDSSASDELQSETGEEATAPRGSHPRLLELAGIIDARQSILDRLPEDQPLVEEKAQLDGSDADSIKAFAGSFASREESPPEVLLALDEIDEPPVDLPEDGEVTRVSAPRGALETVDPTTADDQHLQRVGVDPMQFRHAFVPIVFAEGFPAFPDGRPIWLRADYEPEDVHRLFEQYLLMGQAGVRQLFLLQDLGPFMLSELQEFFVLYAWAPRLRAYDIFRIAEFRKIQAGRAIEVEDDHFLKAQRLFDKAMVYMETEDFIGQLTPKTAIDLMKTVVQISRMSVGLPPNAVRQEGGGSTSMEVEAIMRVVQNPKYAKDRGSVDGSVDVNGRSTVGEREDGSLIHGDILADPRATHLAQELVLRMTSTKKP